MKLELIAETRYTLRNPENGKTVNNLVASAEWRGMVELRSQLSGTAIILPDSGRCMVTEALNLVWGTKPGPHLVTCIKASPSILGDLLSPESPK